MITEKDFLEALNTIKAYTMQLQQPPVSGSLPSDMPDLFTDMAQQIHYESVIRGQDMSNVTECFNKLQDGYKRERGNVR